jgi:phosphoadenosine phosphosulfate reductase
MSAGREKAALPSAEELAQWNAKLETATAPARVEWALEHYRPQIILSSSFGAQAAVSLHLVTQAWPEIPVVLADTGYLFPETYRFVDELTARLNLNLRVYRAAESPAWQEARYGREWEQGLEGIERYNQRNKVEPMQRALRELGARAWLTGLRRAQAGSRANLGVLRVQNEVVKVQPIIDWSDRDVYRYLKQHDLPYHPLWEKGYLSIGDTHTSRPVSEGVTEEQSRFFGLKRECGLHEEAPGRDGDGI